MGSDEGPDFQVDGFLASSYFKPCAVYRRGQRRSEFSRHVDDCSGFNLEVSEADGDRVPQQIQEAILFLRDNKAELERLMAFPNLECVHLDFAWDFPYETSFGQFVCFPADLLHECVDLGIVLEVSVYGAAEPTDDDWPYFSTRFKTAFRRRPKLRPSWN